LFIFCAILRLHTYETVVRKLVIKTFGSFTAHEQKLIAPRAMVVLDCLGIYGFTQEFSKTGLRRQARFHRRIKYHAERLKIYL